MELGLLTKNYSKEVTMSEQEDWCEAFVTHLELLSRRRRETLCFVHFRRDGIDRVEVNIIIVVIASGYRGFRITMNATGPKLTALVCVDSKQSDMRRPDMPSTTQIS